MEKSIDKKINHHYDKDAIKYKKSKLSTIYDKYIRDQETDFIINIIKNDKKKLKFLDELNDFVMSIQKKYENA